MRHPGHLSRQARGIPNLPAYQVNNLVVIKYIGRPPRLYKFPDFMLIYTDKSYRGLFLGS